MITILEINEKKVPAIRIDHALDEYDNVILFPEKLVKANEKIKKSGAPSRPGNEEGKK